MFIIPPFMELYLYLPDANNFLGKLELIGLSNNLKNGEM